MTPEITEFSYGFALTNEIVGWESITAAPLFPSLIEEGKQGGGFDVRLDMPGLPLYIQFKRADCMIRRSSQEIRSYNLPISLPFYRFHIADFSKSDQHELLLSLDDGSCLVFYAAPLFHERAEINDAWNENAVATRSIFVAPNSIGELDTDPHHVAYDQRGAWLCSEPVPVEILNSVALVDELSSRLEFDHRPLREKIGEIVEQIYLAEQRAISRVREKRAAHALKAADTYMEHARRIDPARRPIPVRPPRTLSEWERQLRELADTAARVFDVQLIIVQPSGSTAA
jgi:hypothetical protein